MCFVFFVVVVFWGVFCSFVCFFFSFLSFNIGLFFSGQCPYFIKNNLDISPFYSQLENRVLRCVKSPQGYGMIFLGANRAGNCQTFLPEGCFPALIKFNLLMQSSGPVVTTHIPFPEFLRLGIK